MNGHQNEVSMNFCRSARHFMGEQAFSKPPLKLHSEVSGQVQFTLNCHSAEIWHSNGKIFCACVFCACEVTHVTPEKQETYMYKVLEIGQKFRLASYQWMHLMCITYPRTWTTFCVTWYAVCRNSNTYFGFQRLELGYSGRSFSEKLGACNRLSVLRQDKFFQLTVLNWS